ncbi:MAG: protein-L-isoaspartate(D-aspartate) O-methyltransferase [Chloroflexota bacterium]|nr:protein-L-isoaspartate(D-aspartate) O-methyltransferase [Chloroflexota bacterium]
MLPDSFAAAREAMIREQLQARGITDTRVLDAMRRVPRHEFVARLLAQQAYTDRALPIEDDQTISQPYMVAWMSQLLALRGGERVLEIGTGSGYQTAVLSLLVGDGGQIYSVERSRILAERASERLRGLHLAANALFFLGDGGWGLPDEAPFDAILCAAAAPAIPAPLRGQLKDSGRLIMPIGGAKLQQLIAVTRQGDRYDERAVGAVRFVPLTGRFGGSS